MPKAASRSDFRIKNTDTVYSVGSIRGPLMLQSDVLDTRPLR